MPETLIISEPFGDVLLSSDVPCLIVRWHSFANSAQFRSLMERALVQFQENSHHTWPLALLMDSRQMSALVPADQYWLETDWNPRAYVAGIRQIAIVSSENIFGRIAMQVYIANTTAREDYTLEPALFTSLEEAKRWLRKHV